MNCYTSEENVLILVALLKKHGIKRVVASPGTTNLTFVACLQYDDWFEVYSSVDERSAAYIACGMATESGEPVVLTCTEATASRNYMSGLTEAYYRKLPILAVTGYRGIGSVGHLVTQAIDRSVVPNDVARFSVELPPIHDEEERWLCQLNANKAILELSRDGGGPVHINLCTMYSKDFSVKQLPEVKAINRITIEDILPKLDASKKIAIYIGAHRNWTDEEITLIDEFCEKSGAVVMYDHTSRYKGKYGILISLIGTQEEIDKAKFIPDLLIYFGEISGGVSAFKPKDVWRVSEDGELRDRFHKLSNVYEMSVRTFLRNYIGQIEGTQEKQKEYLEILRTQYKKIYDLIPELPFSNVWMAQKSSKLLPENSFLYLGILNTLRSWNFFDIPDSVDSISNVGGFGIDGGISALFGASLINKERLHFCITGDLAFFYDMNVLGNRHMHNNVRILLINNGRGTEFRNYGHPGAAFGDSADAYIAAAGHFGNKSPILVKHYAEDLGFEYLKAIDKESYLEQASRFFSKDKYEKPIVFEVFTDSADESKAIEIIRNVYSSTSKTASMRKFARKMLGESAIDYIKQIKGNG